MLFNVIIFISLFSFAISSSKYAVLIAGSNGYENYRHQADICHAYNILSEGAKNDENIILMTYDDIQTSCNFR